MVSLKFKEVLCLLYSGVLFLSGAVLTGFAIVLCYKVVYHFKFVPDETLGPFILLCLAGIAHLFITWVGVKGPSKEHDFFIIMFAVFCVILFALEVATAIWSLVQWAGVEAKSIEIMIESQAGYFKQGLDKNEWIRLETKLQCCGINGTNDYFVQSQPPPLSCYKCFDQLIIDKNTCKEYYETGCGEILVNYVEWLLLQGALVGFLSGLYQALGVASFVIYYRALKEERAVRAANRASRLRQSLASHASRTNPNYVAGVPVPPAPSAPS